MNLFHEDKVMGEIEDKALWCPVSVLPTETRLVLVTLEDDSEKWVEPGWYTVDGFYDLRQEPFDGNIVAWMKFPEPY